jgi:hypothetical protein
LKKLLAHVTSEPAELTIFAGTEEESVYHLGIWERFKEEVVGCSCLGCGLFFGDKIYLKIHNVYYFKQFINTARKLAKFTNGLKNNFCFSLGPFYPKVIL